MSIIHQDSNHRKINTLEEIEILEPASSEKLLNDDITGQSNPKYISELNSKINSPDHATNKIMKTNNYNNQ